MLFRSTADLMFALISSEELENLKQIMVKQLKNRYNALSINRKFAIGIDREKMRLHDVDILAQKTLVESGQEFETVKDAKSKFNKLKVN